MRTKIIILWIFIALGFIFHHIYGLAGNVFFNIKLPIDNTIEGTPFGIHLWRIFMEGFALLFALLTLQLTQKWFKWITFIWGIIVTLFNIGHTIQAVLNESSNLSEIFILLITAVASVLLVKNLNAWRNESISS